MIRHTRSKHAIVHYAPGAPADRPVYGNHPGMLHTTATSELGPFATSDTDAVTCGHCLRHLAGVARSRRASVQLSLTGWDPDLPRDGVSRWSVVAGRRWRVWPRPGRDNGWHVEEVDESGQPAGHAVAHAVDGRLEASWVGGYYTAAATLAEARQIIAEVSRAAA